MKTLQKLISQISGAEKVFLFRKKGDEVERLFGEELTFTEEAFDSVWNSIPDEKVIDGSSELFGYFNASPKNDAKKIYLSKFEENRDCYLLAAISNKENSFGPKTVGKLKSVRDLVKEILSRGFENGYAILPEDFFIPFYVYDRKLRRIVFVTRGFRDVLGFEPEDWTKRRSAMYRKIAPEYLQNLRKFYADLLANKETYVDLKIKDNYGNERYLRHFATPIKIGESEKVIGIFIDITNEASLQVRLKSANAKFRTLLEISNDLIFSLNRSGYFMLVNEEGAINLGYKTYDLIGKHFLEIVAEEEKPSVALAFQKILKSNEAVTFDVRFVDAFQNEIPFKITATSLKSDGVITGMIGYGKNYKQVFDEKKKLKDLNEKLLETNRLLALERDRAAEKVSALEKINDMKNEFISNISHELRTPLASIIGFAEAIAEDPSLSRDLIREFNSIILQEGKRLSKLIEDILDYSRLEDGQIELRFERFDLLETLRILLDSYSVQANAKNIEVEKLLPEAEFLIYADKKRIEKAFANIISNAIKFTQNGGKVTVSVKNFLNEISVTISDTGVGIPKDDLKNLFQKFRKFNKRGSHIPGAGLGLALTKQIIDKHGGSIKVTSEVGVGTTVTVILPKNGSE